MAHYATVVALASLHAVAAHVADAAARVARLPGAAAECTAAAVAGGVPSAFTGASVGARAGNVPRLSAAVALGAAPRAAGTAWRSVGALAGDMSILATLVACLRFRLRSAIARDVAFQTAVVAGRRPSLGAARRLVAD